MLGSFCKLLTVIIILAAAAASGGEEYARFDPARKDRLLVLLSGQVLEGEIARAGDVYYVNVPNGQMRIKAADVEFACGTLEEAYRRKRAMFSTGDVQRHLQLAQWALDHRLYGSVAVELSDAIAIEPNHPMIAMLERRLRVAVQPPQAPAESKQTDPDSPSLEELDKLVKSMPAGTIETFTKTIQPLLANNCTSAGCHGAVSSAEFRLERLPAGRAPSRRLTHRNLHAVLKWIDRDRPETSRLLTEPSKPHGGASRPVFSGGGAGQYEMLVDWVLKVGAGPARATLTPIDLKNVPPLQSVPAEVPEFLSTPLEHPGTSGQLPSLLTPEGAKASPQSDVTRAVHQEPAKFPAPEPKIKRGAPIKYFVPVDPFDPEIFNRRYFEPKQ